MNDRLLWETAFILYGAANLLFLAELGTQKKGLAVLAGILGFAGMLCQAASLAMRGWQSHAFPVLRAYDALGLFAVLILCAYFVVQWKWALRSLGFFSTALAFLLTLLSLAYPRDMRSFSPPDLTGSLLMVHIVVILLSFGILAIAFCASLAYLAHDFVLRQKYFIALAKRFPPLTTLDVLTNRLVSLGFVLLSLGIALGSVWAERTWGTWWSFDPKQSLALMTWVVYALYIHARTLSGWKGKRSVMLIVVGFILVLATFFGSNFLPGKHRFI